MGRLSTTTQREEKTLSTNYDPDELVLEKQDVMDLIDAVLIYWNQNKKENLLYIAGLKTMKAGLTITPEKAVKKIWNTLLKFIMVVQYQNALQSAMKNKETWANTLDKIKVTIAKDGIDKAMKKYTN